MKLHKVVRRNPFVDKIFNEDCISFLKSHEDFKTDCILTSPPYNTGRPSSSERSRNNYEGRYDIHIDNKSPEEYISWTIELFNLFDRALTENGVILYNVSYSSDGSVNSSNCDLVWRVISHIIEETPFTVADRIVWKKSSALPNNVSPNKLTRICEDVFVFCRKEEYKSFNCNKQISKVGKNGQKYYNNYYNFIEARNNDGPCSLNKATFSSELVESLLSLYCKEGNLIYDPFMGTGTTAVGAIRSNMHYVGTEISEAQIEYAQNRIKSVGGLIEK